MFLQHALSCHVCHRSLLFISIEVEMAEESSIGDGGSGPCCAKNPTQKNVPKTPPRKKPV